MSSNNNFDNWKKWLVVSIILFSTILVLIGFAFGYLYNNYSNGVCREDPLSYGIDKINNINDDEFICSCTSNSNLMNHFNFDKDGFIKDYEPPILFQQK